MMKGEALIAVVGLYFLYIICGGIYQIHSDYNNCDSFCQGRESFLFSKEPEQVAAKEKIKKGLKAEENRYLSKMTREQRQNYHKIIHE